MKSLLFLTFALVASFVSSGVIENTQDSLECPMENVNFSGEDLIWFDAGIESWNECGGRALQQCSLVQVLDLD